MRKPSATFYAILLTAFVGACCSCPGKSGSVAVALHPQKTTLWCWAASGQMILSALGTTVTQCDEANLQFARVDCCDSPTPEKCINGGWPEFAKYGYTYLMTGDIALTWKQVRKQIHCRKQPFAFSWHYAGGGGHMMVATGYETVGNQHFVCVNDPLPENVGDQSCKTYEEYVNGPSDSHWRDYYKFAKK